MELISALFVFLLGLSVGSFANVLIDRLPAGKSPFTGRSACDFCRKTLRWYELIPVLSYLAQHGLCRSCGKRLSLQYPVIELVAAFGMVAIASVFKPHTANPPAPSDLVASIYLIASMLRLLPAFLIFLSFLVLFVSDLKYQLLPDSMTALLLISTLALHAVNGAAAGGLTLASLTGYAITGIFSSAFFYAIWRLSAGRGMGFGDVKLSFVLGFLLGYPGIVIALYLAFLTGAAVGVILIIGRLKSFKSKIAFGPFLIAATSVTLIWQTPLTAWWNGFFGL